MKFNLTHLVDMTAWQPDTWYCRHSNDSTGLIDWQTSEWWLWIKPYITVATYTAAKAMHFLFFYSDLGKLMAKDLMLPMISGLAFFI